MNVGKDELFIVLKSYFDRSGQETDLFLTLSGIAATDETWNDIENNWNFLLHDHKPQAEYMHMIEAVPLRGEFSRDKGWNDDMVQGIVNQLISYLSTVAKDKYCQFACRIHMDDYRKLQRETYQLDSPVDMCNECCVERLMEWYLREYKGGLDVEGHYYFDQGEPFEPIFKAKWLREKEKCEKLNEYTEWSHITHVGEALMRNTPGLQVADMFAWANNRELTKPNERWEALALAMRSLMPTKWITWNEETMRRIYRPLIYSPYAKY